MNFLAAATYAQLAASLVLFGTALFPLYAGGAVPTRVWRWSAVAALASSLVATVLHTGALCATPVQLAATGIGRVWYTQIALAGALALATTMWARWIVIALSALNLALFALVGHANAIAGWTGAGVAALHLLAAGGWIGGIVALGLALRAAPAVDMVRRFSRVGMVFVVTLAITGAAGLFQITGAATPMAAFSYGLIAWGKVALFAVALGLAAFNRAHATPRGAWRTLTLSIALELLVLGAALTLAVALAATDPQT